MNNYCIISHQYEFIYVPIAKAACTTILCRIAEIIHKKDIKELLSSSHRDVHARRKEIFFTQNSEISYNTADAFKKYNNYFKFAFVRNPYDRVHSCYVDKLSLDTYGFDNNLITKYNQLKRGMAFSNFLKIISKMSIDEMDEHFRPQHSFFPLNEADFVGRIETLEKDWNKIAHDIIHIDTGPLPVFNKTQEIDYYEIESENLALQIYEKDFDLFNYSTVRPVKTIVQRELPLTIKSSSTNNLYPFKDVFLYEENGLYSAKVNGNDPVLIIPHFKIREDKHVGVEIVIHSEIDTTLRLFYTTERYLNSPQKYEKIANLKKGDNQISFVLTENGLVGRLRLKVSEHKGVFTISEVRIFETTPPWLEDPNDLTAVNKKLFSLPEYCQKHKNLFSMCNFASIYMPILNVLKPAKICEIGSDQGNNTDLLVTFCNKNNIELDIVDPIQLNSRISDSKGLIRHHKKKSIEYLVQVNKPANVYFIDGDHNYKNVSAELTLIDKLTKKINSPVCMFIHEMSWPWAYRDLYYSPDELLPKDRSATSDISVSPYSESPVHDGLPTLDKYVFSRLEGGEANGVRKAVEDFLHDHTDWKFTYIPSLYGLGILWTDSRLSDEQAKVLYDIDSHTNFFKDFLSILEWNRIALYCMLQRNAKVWRENQSYIKKLESDKKLISARNQKLSKKIIMSIHSLFRKP